MAVALNKRFFDTLPKLQKTSKEKADIAWLLYDLTYQRDNQDGYCLRLRKVDEVYTEFTSALHSITTPQPGDMRDFMSILQKKLDEQLETPPTNQTVDSPLGK